MRRASHIRGGLVFILVCVGLGIGLFVLTQSPPKQKPAEDSDRSLSASAQQPAQIETNDTRAVVEASAEAPAELAPTLSAETLVGTWGPAANNPSGTPNASCDTDNVVTFNADGTYRDGGSFGRYRVSGSSITYYNRVMYDEAAQTEDRSAFDSPLVTKAALLDRVTLRENGALMRRCSAG